MRYFLPIFVLFLALAANCANYPNVTRRANRLAPIHKGVESEFKSYLAIYKTLAFLHNLEFKSPVTIGFANINLKENFVGMCTYGKNFREIDVDHKWWKAETPLARQTLIFHELTHCLCGRDHDWGIGVHYPEADEKSSQKGMKIVSIDFTEEKVAENGFLDDECPMSIMYPHVIDDDCMEAHKEMYLQEMFERCKPYSVDAQGKDSKKK